MLILKAAALAIVVCVLVLCLKKDQPGFAFLLSLCGAAGLLWFAVQQLRPLLARLQQLAGQAGGVHVRLVYPADREQAETLLQNFAGDLPYTLENTQ